MNLQTSRYEMKIFLGETQTSRLYVQNPMAKTGFGSDYETPIECERSDLKRKTEKYDDYKTVLNINANSTILVNRTLEISCIGKEWKCVTLDCEISKFLMKKRKVLEMNLQITFTPPNIG
jgi:hypothetical protein